MIPVSFINCTSMAHHLLLVPNLLVKHYKMAQPMRVREKTAMTSRKSDMAAESYSFRRESQAM